MVPPDLGKQKDFEHALVIISIGLRLVPDDHRFRHQQQALWQNWLFILIPLQRVEGEHRALTTHRPG
ncbi:MAG: hypothetical protein QF705_03460, partial [Arenicellales bacterium]|nr:hypothetical protein [Arenicellales bacterium]